MPAKAIVTYPTFAGHAALVVELFPTMICPTLAQALARFITFINVMLFVFFMLFDFVMLVGCNNDACVMFVRLVNDDADDGGAKQETGQFVIWSGLGRGGCDAG